MTEEHRGQKMRKVSSVNFYVSQKGQKPICKRR